MSWVGFDLACSFVICGHKTCTATCKYSQQRKITAVNNMMGENTTCCICFVVINNETPSSVWTCTTCRKMCHMTCISIWAQTNHDTRRSAFSCPVCRQSFDLSSLPGFFSINTPEIPLGIPAEIPVRPSLSSFIASVLHSTSPSESPPTVGSQVPNRSLPQRQPPRVTISGTGPVHVERLTVINHF